MIVTNRGQAAVIRTRHGSEIRPLLDRTNSGITRCSLAEELLPPAHEVSPHHHDEIEEVYYILEGSGVMTVGEEQRQVRPGDAIYVPRGHTHSLNNTGQTMIRLLLVCGPAFYREDEILEQVLD